MEKKMSRPFKVCAVQTGAVGPNDLPDMVQRTCAEISRAGSEGCDIISFPELYLSPFFANRLDESARKYFISISGPEMEKIRGAVAKAKINAVVPFAEYSGVGYHNSAAVFDRSGSLVQIYRKTHIPAYFPTDRPGGTGSYEKLYFQPGDQLKTVMLDGVSVGVLICYDRLFPEASRSLALDGAEVIIIPISYSNYSDADHRSGIWDVPIRSRAYENGVFVVACNRVGVEGVRQHIGRSLIVDPKGAILLEGDGANEDRLSVTLDIDSTQDARINFPWWRDRRPDLYRTSSSEKFGRSWRHDAPDSSLT
jgi:predicted amidohydrolase